MTTRSRRQTRRLRLEGTRNPQLSNMYRRVGKRFAEAGKSLLQMGRAAQRAGLAMVSLARLVPPEEVSGDQDPGTFPEAKRWEYQ